MAASRNDTTSNIFDCLTEKSKISPVTVKSMPADAPVKPLDNLHHGHFTIVTLPSKSAIHAEQKATTIAEECYAQQVAILSDSHVAIAIQSKTAQPKFDRSLFHFRNNQEMNDIKLNRANRHPVIDISIRDLKDNREITRISNVQRTFGKSPNGSLVCRNIDGEVIVWDIKNSKATPRAKETSTDEYTGTFTAVSANEFISSTFVTESKRETTIWHTSPLMFGKMTIQHPYLVNAYVPFPNDNILLAIDSTNGIHILNSTTGKELGEHFLGSETTILAVACSNRSFVTASFNSITLWNVTDKNTLPAKTYQITCNSALKLDEEHSIYSMTRLANGDIVTGHDRGKIAVWTINNNEITLLQTYQVGSEQNSVAALDATEDGNLAYTLTGPFVKVGVLKLPLMLAISSAAPAAAPSEPQLPKPM